MRISGRRVGMHGRNQLLPSHGTAGANTIQGLQCSFALKPSRVCRPKLIAIINRPVVDRFGMAVATRARNHCFLILSKEVLRRKRDKFFFRGCGGDFFLLFLLNLSGTIRCKPLWVCG